jgi:TolA-binding protein
MRTRVFLVLVAIAVGGSAAGIYLAIDAQNNSVSKADVEAVRDELATQVAPAGDSVTQLESELQALRDEVDALRASEAGGKRKAQEQPVK